MGMGIHRVVPAEFGGDLGEQLQHYRECFARGQICGYQREVLSGFLYSWLGTYSCPIKVHKGAFHE